MQNILFRADSSSSIGTGHIMRDLVLASQLKKQFPTSQIFFATLNLKGNINNKIIEAGYNLIILHSNTKEELLTHLKQLGIDMLIIDHYDINYSYEKFIKINSNVKILALDDTYSQHNCDILLNHNISANQYKYQNLVPSTCELRCGPKFTLIRDEFRKIKARNKLKMNSLLDTVFIAMGGADSYNMNINILKTLKIFKNLKINLVTTTANQNLEPLKKFVRKNKNISLYINSDNIGEIMSKSNIAIITPSVILNEIIFMQIPFIAVYVTENQKEIYSYLKSNQFYCLKSAELHKIKSFFQKLKIPSIYHKNILQLKKINGKMK